MFFLESRTSWPQNILSFLPLTFFFPVGIMYAGIGIFFISYLLSGDFKTKWLATKSSPLFFPVLGLTIVCLLSEIFSKVPLNVFFIEFVHYQIYFFLLLFISVGSGDWQRRAVYIFFAGAILASTFFYLNYFDLLPSISIFKSYITYSGNKSILLGILLGIAGAWMLYELISQSERRWFWLRIFTFLYVVIALLFLTKSRTASLIFICLCIVISGKYFIFSWRNIGLLAIALAIVIIFFKLTSVSNQRIENTIKDIAAFSQSKKISDEGIRLTIYQKTIEIISEKPLLGHGIGAWLPNFQSKTKNSDIEMHTTPHNDYLLYTSELGLLGLFSLLWIWLTQLIVAWRIGGDHGVWLAMLGVAIMVGGMFNAILRDALFGMPFMILLAIPLAGVTRKKIKQ